MAKKEAAEHEGLWEWPNGTRIRISYVPKQKAYRFEWLDGTGGIWVEPKDIWEYKKGLKRVIKRYILEHKYPYTVPEPLTKNRTCQSSRWEQIAISDSKDALGEYIAKQDDPHDWQIVDRMPNNTQEGNENG